MSALIPWFATIGFVLAVAQAGASAWRWWRVPTFEIVEAAFSKVVQSKYTRLGTASLTVLAHGGGRARHIVNWGLVAGPINEDGSSAMSGINMIQPIYEMVPANDTAKFSLISDGLTIIVGGQGADAKRLKAVLSVDFGKYREDVEFVLSDAGSGYVLEDAILRPTYMGPPRSVRSRIGYELKKRAW